MKMLIFLPIISVCVVGLGGANYIGRYGSLVFLLGGMAGSFIIAVVSFVSIIITGVSTYYTFGDWINIGNLFVTWVFVFDSLSVVMLFVITFITLLVMFYSLEYMRDDPSIVRFFIYLSLFAVCMFLMVTAGICYNFF